MNRLLSILVVLVWGVWVGSLVGVFVAVTSLSRTFAATGPGGERTVSEMFGLTAGNVFGLYERVQLVLAAVALVLSFAWRICHGATRQKTALFVLFALAAASAVVEAAYVAPQINRMREAQEVKSDRFKLFHGLSFGLYSANILLLAVGGAIVPVAIAREARERASTLATPTTTGA
jgi:FtsH-binding integral membrane protein